MPSGIKVQEAMRKKVVVIEPDRNALEAAMLMKKEDIGSLIVVKNGKAVGIVTREDINDKVAAKDLQASKLLVKEIMNAPVVSCAPDDDISSVSQTMSKYGYERLPVIDKGELIGIISTREIVKVAPAAIEIFRHHFEEESTPTIKETETIDDPVGYCEGCENVTDDVRKIDDAWLCQKCREEGEAKG